MADDQAAAAPAAPSLRWEPVANDFTTAEAVYSGAHIFTSRAPVEGGWIYNTLVCHQQGAPETVQVFVPAKG